MPDLRRRLGRNLDQAHVLQLLSRNVPISSASHGKRSGGRGSVCRAGHIYGGCFISLKVADPEIRSSFLTNLQAVRYEKRRRLQCASATASANQELLCRFGCVEKELDSHKLLT